MNQISSTGAGGMKEEEQVYESGKKVDLVLKTLNLWF